MKVDHGPALIEALLNYGLETDLLDGRDLIYTRNRLVAFCKIDSYEASQVRPHPYTSIAQLLKDWVDWAYAQGLITSTHPDVADIFDTTLMDFLCPQPSAVEDEFWRQYAQGSKQAMDWYYQFSKQTHYIRTDRIAKNIVWDQETAYGPMVVTINMSKPEKDPKAIASQARLVSTQYPKCLLCAENVGFEGHSMHPARQTHRVIPIELGQEPWFLQYSPYVYYNEHAIVVNQQHVPMAINYKTFERLLDFIDDFDHYFIGSNADLPIVGGSMLSHDHYQAGHYEMPMAKAGIRQDLEPYNDVNIAWVQWPLTTLRLRAPFTPQGKGQILKAAQDITSAWRQYSDEILGIACISEGEAHHTVTPIARRSGQDYEIDLVLRNNQRSAEHPDGVYHPHAHVHCVKKENIGLIEVMGLAVLPPRLETAAQKMAAALVLNQTWQTAQSAELAGFEDFYTGLLMQTDDQADKQAIQADEQVDKQAIQADEQADKQAIQADEQADKQAIQANEQADKQAIDQEAALHKVYQAMGQLFVEGLEHCGVFKLNDEGNAAMHRFMQFVSSQNRQGGRA